MDATEALNDYLVTTAVTANRKPVILFNRSTKIPTLSDDIGLRLNLFDPDTIYSKLSVLNRRKPAGSDGLHPKFLRMFAELLCVPFANLFNFCIVQVNYPTPLKCAIVVPVPKTTQRAAYLTLTNKWQGIQNLYT